MTRSQGISQFYLHTPRSSANGMNHTCLCLPSRSGTHLPTPEGWKAELVLGGWLVTYRNKCPAPGIETDTVAHFPVGEQSGWAFVILHEDPDIHRNFIPHIPLQKIPLHISDIPQTFPPGHFQLPTCVPAIDKRHSARVAYCNFILLPSYLRECVTASADVTSRPRLRSTSSQRYERPRTCLKFGDRSFSSAGSRAWNSLPSSLQELTDPKTFKRKLKTFLFSRLIIELYVVLSFRFIVIFICVYVIR